MSVFPRIIKINGIDHNLNLLVARRNCLKPRTIDTYNPQAAPVARIRLPQSSPFRCFFLVTTRQIGRSWTRMPNTLPPHKKKLGTLGLITRQAHHHFQNHLDHWLPALHRFRRVYYIYSPLPLSFRQTRCNQPVLINKAKSARFQRSDVTLM